MANKIYKTGTPAPYGAPTLGAPNPTQPVAGKKQSGTLNATVAPVGSSILGPAYPKVSPQTTATPRKIPNPTQPSYVNATNTTTIVPNYYDYQFATLGNLAVFDASGYYHTISGTLPNQTISKRLFGIHLHDPKLTTISSTFPIGSWRTHDSYTEWNSLNPTQGIDPTSWDWSTLDAVANTAVAHDIDVLYTMGITPTWAAKRPHENGPYGFGTSSEPNDIGTWYTYVKAVAQRYKGKIKYYEFWNEAFYCDGLIYNGAIGGMITGDADSGTKYFYLGNKSLSPTIPNGSTFTINGVTVTTGATTTVAAMVSSINAASIPGVTAVSSGGGLITFKLTVSATTKGQYYSMTMVDGTNTPLALCGITAQDYIYNAPFYSGNIQSMYALVSNAITTISSIDPAAQFVMPSGTGDVGHMRNYLGACNSTLYPMASNPYLLSYPYGQTGTGSTGYLSSNIANYHFYTFKPDSLPLVGGESQDVMKYLSEDLGTALFSQSNFNQKVSWETWITEFGWINIGPNSAATQDGSAAYDLDQLAINCVKYYSILTQLGITRGFLYAADRGSDDNSNVIRLLINLDGTPTRAGLGWTQLARWLVGATPAGFTTVNSNVWALRYVRGSDVAWIVWNVTATYENSNIYLLSWPGAVQYETLFNNTPTLVNGPVPIGRYPILLQASSITWGTNWAQ
jgi:hypothetical protein